MYTEIRHELVNQYLKLAADILLSRKPRRMPHFELNFQVDNVDGCLKSMAENKA